MGSQQSVQVEHPKPDVNTLLDQPSMALNYEVPDLSNCWSDWKIARHITLSKIVSSVVEKAEQTSCGFLHNLVINCHGDEADVSLGRDGISLSNVHELAALKGLVKRIYIIFCHTIDPIGDHELLKQVARVVDCDATCGTAAHFTMCATRSQPNGAAHGTLGQYHNGHRPPFLGQVYTATPDGSVSSVVYCEDLGLQPIFGSYPVTGLHELVPWPLGQNRVTRDDKMLSLAPPSMVVNYGSQVELFGNKKWEVPPDWEPEDIINYIERVPRELFAGVRGREMSGARKADMLYNLVFNCESDSVWPLRVGSSGFNQANIHLFSSLKGKVDKIFIPMSDFAYEISKRDFALEVSRLADCVVIVNWGQLNKESYDECAKEGYTCRLVPLTHGRNGLQGLVYDRGQYRGLLRGSIFKDVLTFNVDKVDDVCLKCRIKYQDLFTSTTLGNENRTTPPSKFDQLVFVDNDDVNLNHYCIRSTDNEQLGAGAFGQVIKVHSYHWNNQPHHDGCHALKIFYGELTYSELFELQILRTLRHENVLDHIAMGHIRRDQTSFYQGTCILMEYCEGGTLADFVTDNPPLPPAQLVNYTRQLICGLHYLHETVQPKHIIHGNIHGSNILLKERIGATLKIGSVSHTADLTSKRGTFPSISPEMFAWDKDDPQIKVGRSTDIWSLGCVVLEMFLRGRILFRRVGQSSVYMDELNERAQIRLLEEGGVPDVPSELPSPLRQLVLGCLKVVPANRPKAKTLLNLLTPNGGLHGLEDDTAQSAVGAASEEPAFQTPFSMVMGVGSD